jgi:hypothetical protein
MSNFWSEPRDVRPVTKRFDLHFLENVTKDTIGIGSRSRACTCTCIPWRRASRSVLEELGKVLEETATGLLLLKLARRVVCECGRRSRAE